MVQLEAILGDTQKDVEDNWLFVPQSVFLNVLQ